MKLRGASHRVGRERGRGGEEEEEEDHLRIYVGLRGALRLTGNPFLLYS